MSCLLTSNDNSSFLAPGSQSFAKYILNTVVLNKIHIRHNNPGRVVVKKKMSFSRFVCLPVFETTTSVTSNLPVYECSSVYNEGKKCISLETLFPQPSLSPGFSIIFLNHHHLLLRELCRQITVPTFTKPTAKNESFSPFFSFFRPTSPCVCTCPQQ